MSWIQRLHETYNACTGSENIPDIDELCPVGYSVQNAHIEVVIDKEGNFKRASLIQSDQKTLIPVTEKSMTGRTSGIAPHPLCDSVQYCAGDFSLYSGGRESYFDKCKFTCNEFDDAELKPINLINDLLKLNKKKEKKKLPKDKCINWLNKFISTAKSSKNSNIEERIHGNRSSIEQAFVDTCPKNCSSYLLQLERWRNSNLSHQKIEAVFNYVSKKSLVKDLIENNLLAIKDGKLEIVEKTDKKGRVKITNSADDQAPRFEDSEKIHPIFKLLAFDESGIKDQGKVFIRWRVEVEGNPCSETWKDKTLSEKWSEYASLCDKVKGFCYVTGDNDINIAQKHPAKLRNAKDGAKLISSNDESGFTYLGRFISANEAASVSSVVTQKAHSALRWLIGRKQAFRSGDQVIVAWERTGKPIPDPCANSWDFLRDDFKSDDVSIVQSDIGQAFAQRFKKKLAGYKASIKVADDIVVMGLDSATPGRMAITYYRELSGSEFLERIENWHSDFAWLQNYGKDRDDKKKSIIFEGAPAPKDIAWCAYGRKIEGKNGIKLLNTTIERILPSIIDGRPLPRDLVEQCVHRTSNRVGLEHWEFEKCLGIACSLYKGYYKDWRYEMSLEEERNSRDYLYGRLLAIAEKIESMALFLAKEKRETTAERYMQLFADRPYSTWRTIEVNLRSYRARINAKTPGLLEGYKELLDKISCKFQTDEFKKDNRLTGEFLLAYHCQRQWLKEHKRKDGQWIVRTAEEVDQQEETIE